jgi:hypothetical protein
MLETTNLNNIYCKKVEEAPGATLAWSSEDGNLLWLPIDKRGCHPLLSK